MVVHSFTTSSHWLTQYALSSPKPWHSFVPHHEQVLGAKFPRGPGQLHHPQWQLTMTQKAGHHTHAQPQNFEICIKRHHTQLSIQNFQDQHRYLWHRKASAIGLQGKSPTASVLRSMPAERDGDANPTVLTAGIKQHFPSITLMNNTGCNENLERLANTILLLFYFYFFLTHCLSVFFCSSIQCFSECIGEHAERYMNYMSSLYLQCPASFLQPKYTRTLQK